MLLLYLELVVAPDGEKDLSNPHPSCSAVSLAIGTPHSSLEPEQADLKSLLLNFRQKGQMKNYFFYQVSIVISHGFHSPML